MTLKVERTQKIEIELLKMQMTPPLDIEEQRELSVFNPEDQISFLKGVLILQACNERRREKSLGRLLN